MRPLAPLLVLSLLAASCSSGPSEPRVRVAFVQDLTAPDADEHVQPALQAVELALAQGAPGVELELVDVAEDPGVVEEIAADGSFVAALVGPGADGSAFAEAGVPTLSVSTAGPTPSAGTWRRLVAPMPVLADAIAERVGGGHPCIVSEDPPPDELASLLQERLGVSPTTLDPDEPEAALRLACGTHAWVGSPDPAVELARLAPGIALVGGDRLLDPDFRDDVGEAGEGTVAACACVAVTTALDPEVIRFIQDYQSEFGTAPGAYAVEAWDAARSLVAELSGGADRAETASWLASLSTLEGIASAYAFEASGEVSDPAGAIVFLELRSGRWVAT